MHDRDRHSDSSDAEPNHPDAGDIAWIEMRQRAAEEVARQIAWSRHLRTEEHRGGTCACAGARF